MNRRIVMAALATIALSACDRAIETDPALAAAASQSSAPSAAATAAPEREPAAPALANGAAPTKDFMVGKWAEVGDCQSEPIEFKADGSMIGPFERWDLVDGVLTMVGNPARIKLVVIDQKTLESRINDKSEPRKLERCP